MMLPKSPVTGQSSLFGNTQWSGAPQMQAWIPEISSGILAMDRIHHDLFSALDELSLSDDQEFGGCYAEFVRKVEMAFREEEQWMDVIDFPGLVIHQEQHARVLGALHHVHAEVMRGNLALGRRVIEELLPQWLVFHISTMDSPLALAMQLAQSERELAPQAS